MGRIGLRVVPGGFATPPFGDHRTIGVDGTELVVRAGGQERRTPIATLRAAGEFADVEPGAPSDVYKPATPCDLDARLMVDADAARRLAATGDRFWNQPFGADHHLGRRPLGGGRSGVFPAGTPARRQLTDRPAGGRCCQGAA